MRMRSSILRLLLGVSVGVLLLCLLNILLPTSQQLNSRVAIIFRESPQQKFIGRIVFANDNNTAERQETLRKTPTREKKQEEHFIIEKEPLIHRLDSHAEKETTRRQGEAVEMQPVRDRDSPCTAVDKQTQRLLHESRLAEKLSGGGREDQDVHNDPRARFHRSSYSPLSREDLASVEAFVFFVGWQRSGHSIIGSLLDGHPDAVIAHEFFLFNHLQEFTSKRLGASSRARLFNQLVANSFRHAHFGDRSEFRNKKGYNLKMAGSWQGCFRKLRVVGDKAAGEVTNVYRRNTTKFIHHLRSLKSLVRLPLKVIHVVRNPYDMIATLSLYRGSSVTDMKVSATVDDRYSDQEVIKEAATTILVKAHFLQEMEGKGYEWDMIRIHSEDFIAKPTAVMAELCRFLGLECSEDYLQLCADKTFKSTSRSRELIEWDPAVKAQVERSIREIPFFRHYSFEID